MSAVALRRRVARCVHEVDAHALRVDDVVGLVQRPDLLVPRDHSVLPQIRGGCLDPGIEGEETLSLFIQVSILFTLSFSKPLLIVHLLRDTAGQGEDG